MNIKIENQKIVIAEILGIKTRIEALKRQECCNCGKFTESKKNNSKQTDAIDYLNRDGRT